MAGSYKSIGRRVEGPEGVMHKWSLLKIEHSEARSQINHLSLTTGRFLSIINKVGIGISKIPVSSAVRAWKEA